MTKERFESMYRCLAEQRINEFGNMCEHPYFDKLLYVLNSNYGYRLFYPLSGDFTKHGIDFDTYCRVVWPNVHHAVEDDGDICFVHAVLKGRVWKSDKEWTTDEFFIMDGHIAEVTRDKVLSVAIEHHSLDMKLVSYSGVGFSWKLVDFLHGMVNAYFKDGDPIVEKKFDEYMTSDKYFFDSEKGE